MNNASLLTSLRSNRQSWVDRPPVEKTEDLAALQRLAQNPDLEVLLRFLEYRKALAQCPVDPTQAKWQETALLKKGEYDLIVAIASQFK